MTLCIITLNYVHFMFIPLKIRGCFEYMFIDICRVISCILLLFPNGRQGPYAFIVILWRWWWWRKYISESSFQSYSGGVACYKQHLFKEVKINFNQKYHFLLLLTYVFFLHTYYFFEGCQAESYLAYLPLYRISSLTNNFF